MADRLREQLLGYLLGALEESERESVERRLAQDPSLWRELVQIRRRLQPLWAAQPDFAPPPDLAARTCQRVASYRTGSPEGASVGSGNKLGSADPQAEPGCPPLETGSSGGYRGWLDLGVAAGLVVALALLVFPAIQNSRFNARLAACQDQLRQIGVALNQYSEQHQNYFPPVYDQGRLAGAGIYAPILWTHGFVDDPRMFICPGSPLADDRQFRIPRLGELLTAAPEELARLHSRMGGSYGYSLGFFDGRIYTTRDLRRPHFALVADVPSTLLAGYQSVNHGGRGQNVLFEDGRIMFYTSPRPHARADDVFVNEEGMVAAGMNRNDSVVGPSTAVPCLCGRGNCTGNR